MSLIIQVCYTINPCFCGSHDKVNTPQQRQPQFLQFLYQSALPARWFMVCRPCGAWHHAIMPWGYASVQLNCIWYELRCFKVILECPSLLSTLLEIKFPCVTENCLTLCSCTDDLQQPCACRWRSLLKAIQDSNLLSLYLPTPSVMAGLHTPLVWLQSSMMGTLSDFISSYGTQGKCITPNSILQSMCNNNVGNKVYHKFKWEIPTHYADISTIWFDKTIIFQSFLRWEFAFFPLYTKHPIHTLTKALHSWDEQDCIC